MPASALICLLHDFFVPELRQKDKNRQQKLLFSEVLVLEISKKERGGSRGQREIEKEKRQSNAKKGRDREPGIDRYRQVQKHR
jgi:hypothetical protein